MNKPNIRIAREPSRQITQAQIEDYNAQVLALETLKRSVRDRTEIVKVLEEAFVGMLDKGYTQEPGDLRMLKVVTERAVTPKYKELYAEAVGPKAIEIAQAVAGTSTYTHIKVVSGKVQA